MEPKVLQWKWYLQVALEGALVKMGKLKEELAAMPMVPAPVPINLPSKSPIGKWRADHKANSAWFTEGPLPFVMGTCDGRPQPIDPGTGIFTDEGTEASAQIAELMAVKLVVEFCIKTNEKVIHILSDSWCVCNGIAIWSDKWKDTDFCINGKPVWERKTWKILSDAPDSIFVTHVDAHTNKDDEVSKHNATVDKLSKLCLLNCTTKPHGPLLEYQI